MNFDLLLKQHQALMVQKWITNLANTSAFIFQSMPNLNWVGFYLAENQKLYLGPFQGLPACVEIPFGRGVCGKAAQARETLVVADVNSFVDHIACDSRSQAEIVVPVIHKGQLLAVLDVDSPSKYRFDQKDQLFLEKIVQQIVMKIDEWSLDTKL